MSNRPVQTGTILREIVSLFRANVDRIDSMSDRSHDGIRRLAMEVEGVRYLANRLRRSEGPEFFNSIEVRIEIMRDLRSGLASLAANETFREILAETPFSPHLPQSRFNSIPLIGVLAKESNKVALETAIAIAGEAIKELLGNNPEDESPDVATLRSLVPEQKIAPVQFKIEAGRLGIAHTTSNAESVDLENIARAKSTLVVSGDRIIENLKISNCDRRLLESFEDLNAKLASGKDIIQLGLLNIGCDALGNAFFAELPDAVTAMLKAQTIGISLYVAQFPDWSRFTANAAAAHFSDADVSNIMETANSLVRDLSQSPGSVDSEVPKVLAFLAQMIKPPGATSKKAAFATLRTLENLIAKIFSYSLNFVDDTIQTSLKGASKIISMAFYGALVAAVSGALALGASGFGAGEIAWMKPAADFFKNNITIENILK